MMIVIAVSQNSTDETWPTQTMPDDPLGEYIVEIRGYQIQICGTCTAHEVPDFFDIMTIYENSDCFDLELVNSWDCENPGDIWGWCKLYQVVMTCEGDFSFGPKGGDPNLIHTFTYPSSYYCQQVDIKNTCNYSIRHSFADFDEPIKFCAKIYRLEGEEQMPSYLVGRVSGGENEYYIELGKLSEHQLYAEYVSGVFYPRNFTGWETNSIYSRLGFSMHYGRLASAHTSIWQVNLDMDSTNFYNKIPIRNNDKGNTACLPYGAWAELDIRGEVTKYFSGWPFCSYPYCQAIGYVNDDPIFYTSGAIYGDGFWLMKESGEYELPIGPGHPEGELIELPTDWYFRVNLGEERNTRSYTMLKVYNGIRANSIILPNGMDTITVNVGESIVMHANPTPSLDETSGKIAYHWNWSSDDPNADGIFVYGPIVTTTRTNEFYPMYPGTYEITYSAGQTGTSLYMSSLSAAATVSGKPTLTITSPADSSKFTFSSATPGTLNLNFTANTGSPALNDSIVWTMERIGNSILNTPHDTIGANINFNYTNLPDLNDDFGYKLVIASLPAYSISDTIRVGIFYPRDIENNPGGIEPNWYYYWKQTPANIDTNVFGGFACGDTTNGFFAHWGYSAAESLFHLCPHLVVDTSYFGSFGIDYFGEACLHEKEHLKTWFQWWASANPFDSLVDDPDSDYVPSLVETIVYNTDSLLHETVPGTGSDFEIVAYDRQQYWRRGSVNNQDWANPGKQY
jgi:hypothetical protein